jgi:intracellular sulfur oxidation DsrE/DsrF family protein
MSTLNKCIVSIAALTALALLNPSYAAPADVEQAAGHPFIEITKHKNIRVAYDVKDDVWEAGVGKALYYVRGLLDSYQSMGVPPGQLHISVIMHGATAYWLLNEDAYRIHKKDPFDYNPNVQIVRELLAHGVSVEICNSTMKSKGWTGNDLLPGVTIVHDAYTRLIDLQHRNYTYIRF